MGHTYKNHHFHLIWSTKNREKLIDKSFEDRLYAYLGGVIRGNKGILLEVGGIANHVHLLISLASIDNYSELLRKLKGGSSLWLNKEVSLPRKFAWQEGYGSFAVSFSHVEIVQNYIRNQEKHHSTITFEQEYLKFLEVNGIKYDKNHVFD
jgi:REP element-mobilizing transposase RayT